MRCLWVNGVPHGFIVIEYIDNEKGVSQYMGEVNMAMEYHGQGYIKYKNGNYYEGEFENGKYNGSGMLFIEGVKHTGVFLQGELIQSLSVEL